MYNIDKNEKSQNWSLDTAIRGNVDIEKFKNSFSNCESPDISMLLASAVNSCRLDVFKYITQLHSGATLRPDQYGRSILHNIITAYHYSQSFSCFTNVVDTKQYFCSMWELAINNIKVSVNAKSIHNASPLHYTMMHKCDVFVDLLLQHKDIIIEITNNKLNTPLHVAASNNYEYGIDKLIANDANINARNALGKTALHILAQQKDSIQCNLPTLPSIDLDAVDNKGKTALQYAISSNNASVLHAYISKDKVTQRQIKMIMNKNLKQML